MADPLLPSDAGGSTGRPCGRGVFLADLTWPEAERLLRPETVVVLPLGAAAKEHGPHLKLKTDRVQADYLAARLAERSAVVIAPTVTYSYYPAFTEYPGSITLRRETARDLVVDVCRSLAAFGPRRFYVLNTGISTLRPLADAAAALAADGILLRYTDPRGLSPDLERRIARQEGGTHADEVETSRMLYIAPEAVDMSKAVKDYHPEDGPGGLTRDPSRPGVYSPTGVWGDATLATAEKGRALTEAAVEAIAGEVKAIGAATPPSA